MSTVPTHRASRLLLLEDGGEAADPAALAALLAGLGIGKQRIRCPKCRWVPRKDSRWYCSHGGCGCCWNTFDTGGRCPECGHQWVMTQCLSCHVSSLHREWYAPVDEEPSPGAAD